MSAKHTPGHVPEDCSIEECPECAPIFEAREAAKKKLPMGDPTPGPWQHVVEGRGFDVRTVTAGLGENIARRVMRAPDARLIAAAPDLLEALAPVARSLDEEKHPDGQGYWTPYLTREEVAAIRAAVAKAHGGDK